MQEPPRNGDFVGLKRKSSLTSPLNPRLLLMTASPHPVTALELESLAARAGCGATSSAALQPKRVGSKRAARQLEAAAAHTVVAAARRWLQLGILSGSFILCGGKPVTCNWCDLVQLIKKQLKTHKTERGPTVESCLISAYSGVGGRMAAKDQAG